MFKPSVSCRRLLRQTAESADDFARFNAGNSRAARMPMMAITTKSSIRVKALKLRTAAEWGSGPGVEQAAPAFLMPECGGTVFIPRNDSVFLALTARFWPLRWTAKAEFMLRILSNV